MKTGEQVEIIDSTAQRFSATLTLSNHRVTVVLDELSSTSQSAQRWRVSVAQGVPKGQKMDFVVEKLTELGIDQLFPLYSERTIVEDVGAAKIERWRRLAKSAAEQCGRASVPSVHAPQKLEPFTSCFKDYDAVLFPWELADPQPLRETLPSLVQTTETILVVIGPEGGFSNDEAAHAREAGAHLISLGPRILRTETAALVVVGILNYLS